eukprot:1175962-Lingulodinium_polyedra.AAC.1
MRHSVPPGKSHRRRSAVSLIQLRNESSHRANLQMRYMAPPAPSAQAVPIALASVASLRTI